VRREEIASAAMRIIGERGLPALSTSALAAEVGVSTGALFRHFASQDDILRHAALNAVAILESTFPEPSLPAVERLLALARNRVQAFTGNPGLAWFLRSDQAELVLPPDASASLHDLVARSKRFVLDALRQGVREGTVRDDVEPEVLQVLVLATIHSLVGRSAFQSRTSRVTTRPEQVLQGLGRLLAPSATSRTALKHAEKPARRR